MDSVSPEELQMFMGYHSDCLAQTGLSEEIITQVKAGSLPDDAVLKTHILCMNKKLGFQNDAGELQMDRMKAMFSKYSDPAVVDKLMVCIVQKDTPENSAFEVAKCAHQVQFMI